MTACRELLRKPRLASIVMSGLVLATTVILVGQLTPGYSPFSATVSRLASPGQPLALAARLGFVLYGLLVMFGAGPLGEHLPGRERLLGCLIGLFGAAAVTAGIAPKDAPRAAHTAASQLHVGATICGGAAILAAMAVVACRAGRASARRTASVAALLTGVAVIVFKVSWGSQFYGLTERVLLASPMLWLIILACQLLWFGHGSSAQHAPTAQDSMWGSPKPSGWPHALWAGLVVAVVAAILLAVGQTQMPEGDCSGIGFGCSLYGADAAGFVAIMIVPPALGILLLGHMLIAAGLRVTRRQGPVGKTKCASSGSAACGRAYR